MIECSVFLCGGVLMSFEILGSRVLAPHFGNSVYVWGSLISVFLSGLTVGYWSGGNLADRRAEFRVLACLLGIPGLLLCCFPVYSDWVCNWIWDLDYDPRWGSLLASAILFFLPTFFMGAVSPYAVKLRIREFERLGTGVGNLYAISSLGSILGTLVTAFYLIGWMGVRKTITGEGILLVGMGCLVWVIGDRKGRAKIDRVNGT
jgi:MFS family permease